MSRHIKALVVEDEIKIGNYIKNKIEYLDSGFRVQGVAENGKQALEMIKKSQPQVVFTDISMPEMDGLELSRLIRNTYSEVLVVIISGYSDFEYAQKAIRYGVFNYLLKPLEDEKLSDVLIDIRKSLMNEGNGRERALLYSDGYVLNKEGAKYIILYVCVGNMIYDVRERELTEHYRRAMEEIPWRAVMDKLCGKRMPGIWQMNTPATRRSVASSCRESRRRHRRMWPGTCWSCCRAIRIWRYI